MGTKVTAFVCATILYFWGSATGIATAAQPGDKCLHSYECHPGVCLADGPMAQIGHCAKIRVLP
jgi:hypothetical protein